MEVVVGRVLFWVGFFWAVCRVWLMGLGLFGVLLIWRRACALIAFAAASERVSVQVGWEGVLPQTTGCQTLAAVGN